MSSTIVDLLREALGPPRRAFARVDRAGGLGAATWDCGCFARVWGDVLHDWRTCPHHRSLRDGLIRSGIMHAQRAGV